MMSDWADLTFAIALLAPVVALVIVFASAAPATDHRWTTAGCSVAAAGCFVLLVAGQRPRVAGLAPDDLALAACLATAVLALALAAATRVAVVGAVVTVLGVGVSVADAEGPSTVAVVVAVAVAVVLLAATVDADRNALVVMAAGAILAAGGVRSGGPGGEVAVLFGSAAVIAAASLGAGRVRRSTMVVVPAALAYGLRAAVPLASSGTGRWAGAVLAGAATVIALLPVATARLRSRRPATGATTLALWSLAAATSAVTATAASSRLLAAGAVIALGLGGSVSLLAAVPGVAVFASAVADAAGWPRAVLGALAMVSVAAIVFGSPPPTGAEATARPRTVDGALIALGAWLVVRPSSWTWAGAARLGRYDEGVVLALAAGLVAGVLTALAGGSLADGRAVDLVVADAGAVTLPVRRSRIAVMVVLAAMGIVAAALVRSARL